MTATLPVQPDTTGLALALVQEQTLREEAEKEVAGLRAGMYAMVDLLVERAQIVRRNNGHYPPTADDLAEVADDTTRFWLGVALAAAAAAGAAL